MQPNGSVITGDISAHSVARHISVRPKAPALLWVSGTENSNEYREFASASHPRPFYWFVPWVRRLTAAGDLVADHWVYSVVVVLLWLMLFLV